MSDELMLEAAQKLDEKNDEIRRLRALNVDLVSALREAQFAMTDGGCDGPLVDAALVSVNHAISRSEKPTQISDGLSAVTLRDFTLEQLKEELQWREYRATNFEKE